MDEFDFWLGTWKGSWTAEAGIRTCVNRITKEYAGKVIVERFSADAPEELNGLSVSVFDTADGCWKQTWVDDSGSYLDFRGEWDGERMILGRQAAEFRQRMVWHEIEADSFQWLWQRSPDGEEWQTVWQIEYERIDG